MSPRVIRILWVLYFLCLVPAIVTLSHRAQFDEGFNSVALVADYVQLLELAQTENVGVDEILARVRDEAGIERIALLEDTPEFLELRGLCTIIEGVGWPGWKTPEERDRIERNRGREIEEAEAPSTDWPLLMGLRHDLTQLVFSDPDAYRRIAAEALDRYPGLVETTDKGDDGGIVSLAGEPKITLEWGLGFDPDLVEHLRSMGFILYPRLRNYAGYSDDTGGAIMQQTAAGFPMGWLIFDGDSVFSSITYADLHNGMGSDGQSLGGVGWIEFAEQKGASSVAHRIPNSTARVHSIEDEEMEVITPERAVARFLRAVRERTVRIVYLKPFLLQVDQADRIDRTLTMFKGTRTALERTGFAIGEPSVIAADLKANLITRLAAILALAIGLTLLLRTLGHRVSGISAIVLTVAVVVVCLVLGFAGPKLAALGLALVSPTLAVTWLVRKYESALAGTQDAGKALIGPTIVLWLGALGITLTGAFLIAASLIETRTLLAIDSFSGVKLALYLPILLAVIIGVQLIVPEEKRALRGGIEWLLASPIRIWHVVLGIVALIALFIMIDRSGNFPILSVADWENDIRGWFESALYARPRTKEMFVGHPALIIGLYLGLSQLGLRRPIMYAGLVVGSIALTSMTNTFCHLHTPLVLSIWRTVGGAVIGLAVGIVVSVLIVAIFRVGQRRGWA